MTEDIYLLLRPEELVHCVIVPSTGGVFITPSKQALHLHSDHGVVSLRRTQANGYAQIPKANIEVHHDKSVVRQMIERMVMMERQSMGTRKLRDEGFLR
jgi:hypothetical protein